MASGRTRSWQPGDKTVVLIPFPMAISAEHLQSTRGKKSELFDWYSDGWPGSGFKFGVEDVVCEDSPKLDEKLGGLKKATDVLYIRGHGGAGEGFLESSDHSKRINVEGLVSLLKKKLPTEFQGAIKIYACESSNEASRLFGMFLWESFTQQFADAMWGAGYRSCRFYGYGDKVATHSYSASDTIGGGANRGGGHKFTAKGQRASSVRKEIFPKQKG